MGQKKQKIPAKIEKQKGRPTKAFATTVAVFIVWTIIIYVISEMADAKLLENFSELDAQTIIVVLAAYTGYVLLWVYNWKSILKEVGVNKDMKKLTPLALSEFFVDNITPSMGLGGQAFAAYMLKKKEKVRFHKSVPSLMFQVMCWFMGFLLFALVTLFLILREDLILEQNTMIVFGAVITVFTALFLLLLKALFNEKFSRKVLKRVFTKFSGILHRYFGIEKMTLLSRIDDGIELFHQTTRQLKEPRFLFLQGMIVFLTIHLLETVALVEVTRAMGAELSFPLAALALTISALVGLITMLPGGMGGMEGMLVLTLTQSGVPVDIALSATALHRLVFYWLNNFLGGLSAVKMGVETIFPKATRSA